jgi:hypothetical protein
MNKGIAVLGLAALMAMAACGGSETDMMDTTGMSDTAMSTMPGMGPGATMGMTTGATTGATTKTDTTRIP